MITRFVLENIAARVLPGKMPPYFLFGDTSVLQAEHSGISFLPDAETASPDGYDFSEMSDGELADMVRTNALGIPMQMPLEIRTEGGDWWMLPVEPMVSVSGKNVITKKQVSKGRVRGTIKERWTQDDYEISIEGILIDFEGAAYPTEDVKKLREFCEKASVEVSSPLFEIFSIDRMVIESYSFPFTSGPANQAYSISAVSDDIYRLLLKKEDLKQL